MSNSKEMVILGLGSNVGDRLSYLKHAVSMLTRGEDAAITQPRLSPVYETPALLKEDAPPEWNIPFYNAVIVATTAHPPRIVLKMIKQIERKVGRIDRGHWAPREIDIDILAYGTKQLAGTDLTLPHPRLHERAFVLLPLDDILPFWVYPAGNAHAGKTVKQLLQALPPHALATCKKQTCKLV